MKTSKFLNLWKQKKILIIPLIFLIFVIGFLLFNPAKANAKEEEIIWREYIATTQDITASLDGSGKLEITGIPHSMEKELVIDKLLVEAGQEVQEGDHLIEFSKTALEAKIKELENSLVTARLSLKDAQNNKQKQKIESNLSDKESALNDNITLENQKRDLENGLNNANRKVDQLGQNLASLEEELKNTLGSSDYNGISLELTRQRELLAKLQKELLALEANASVSGSDSSGGQNSAILKKKEEIAGVETLINTLNAKLTKITTLNESIQQTKNDLTDAQGEQSNQNSSLSSFQNQTKQKDEVKQEKQTNQDKIDSLTLSNFDSAIQNADAEVTRLEEELEAYQNLLESPFLKASCSGIVTSISYTKGDSVPPLKTILTLGTMEEKLVIAQIPQEDIINLTSGQLVEMQFLANPDANISGYIKEKSFVPSEGGEGVTYKVTIAFDENQPDLLHGMTCGVKFILKRVENVLTISNKAITIKDGQQYVTLRLPDGTHEERQIHTGFSDGRISEVTQGLSEGDVVVVAG